MKLSSIKAFFNQKGSRRKLTGAPALVVRYACIALVIWEVYAVIVLHPFDMLYLPMHVCSILTLSFLLYAAPGTPKDGKIPWYDYLLSLTSFIAGLYYFINTTRMVYRHAFFDPVLLGDLIAGTVLILLLVEATRRIVGSTLLIVGGIFLLYPFLGMYVPGLFQHRGFAYERVIEMLTMTTSGIFGTPTNVAASYALMFVLFGALLDKTGTGEYFFDLAQGVAGGTRGGLAKTSIVSSALFGSISGSPISNVVTTGTFTIPAMKKNGYMPYFASAVETAASCGGTIMPPVMGSVAFVMAEIIGRSYGDVLIAAIFPALLYYLAVFIGADSQAVWRNLRGLTPEEVRGYRRSLLSWNSALGFVLPMVWLVYRVIIGFTAPRAAFEATVLVIAINLVFGGRRGRINFGDLLDGLEKTIKDIVLVSVACAASGIIIGTIILTGIGPKITSTILALSQNNIMLSLFFTALITIMLGMGMSITPTYIIASALAAPALISIGVETVPAHLFIVYFAAMATMTPPVALAAYTAAGIADADPVKTGWTAFRLGIVAYIIPFVFVFRPQVLMMGSVGTIIFTVITVGLAVVALAYGLSPFFLKRNDWFDRGTLLISALLLFWPNNFANYGGVLLLATSIARQFYVVKRDRQSEGVSL